MELGFTIIRNIQRQEPILLTSNKGRAQPRKIKHLILEHSNYGNI
jgi:hypothetical protein